MSELIRVGITHGDYNGVGYEVTLKALANETITELFTPILYGVPALVDRAASEFELELPRINIISEAGNAKEGFLNIVDLGIEPEPEPGKCDAAAGEAAVKALEQAVSDVLAGTVDTLVTAPISKEAVQSDRFHFTGHTEFLAERAQSEALMILFSDNLRVALLNTHKAIADVPACVKKDAIIESVKKLDTSLRRDFSIERPKIAILSLNPHCGDGGLLGDEEINEINPALQEMQDSFLTFGPYAADGFFATGAWKKFDGVLAMYHDQGLAPFKALAGSGGVNFTAGLPFVRTSPDHGTGYDIAWKGIADPESMRLAMYAAVDLTRNRRRNDTAAANPLPPMPERPERPERIPRPHKEKPAEQKQTEQKQTEQ